MIRGGRGPRRLTCGGGAVRRRFSYGSNRHDGWSHVSCVGGRRETRAFRFNSWIFSISLTMASPRLEQPSLSYLALRTSCGRTYIFHGGHSTRGEQRRVVTHQLREIERVHTFTSLSRRTHTHTHTHTYTRSHLRDRRLGTTGVGCTSVCRMKGGSDLQHNTGEGVVPPFTPTEGVRALCSRPACTRGRLFVATWQSRI